MPYAHVFSLLIGDYRFTFYNEYWKGDSNSGSETAVKSQLFQSLSLWVIACYC